MPKPIDSPLPNTYSLAAIPVEPPFRAIVHLQGTADQETLGAGGHFLGTRGESRRLEGFQLDLSPLMADLGLRYMAHLQDSGDTDWVPAGTFVGTRGESRRLEGFRIEATGPLAAVYDVFYSAHIEGSGDTKLFKNGDFCGTQGKSLRCEGIQVLIKLKGI